MSERNIIIGMIVSTLLILFGGVFFLSKTTATPQINSSQDAKISTDVTEFDWGNIPYSGGDAIKIFTIKNIGTDTLRLFNVKTSCHCTKARVSIAGKDSPDFGMSGFSSWVGEVSPGKEAKLTVIFDPTYHGPQGVGPVNRFVSLETNDSTNAKLTFTLTGTVVK